MVAEIYPKWIAIEQCNSTNTVAAFLYLHLLISNKNFDKGDDFDFDIVNFPFLDGDIPRTLSYGVYSVS